MAEKKQRRWGRLDPLALLSCKLCRRAMVDNLGLAVHLRHAHRTRAEEYYAGLLGFRPTCPCGARTAFRGLAAGFARSCPRGTCLWARRAAEGLGMAAEFRTVEGRGERFAASRSGSFRARPIDDAFLRSLPFYGMPVGPVSDRTPVVLYPDARGRVRTWRPRFYVRDRRMAVEPVLLSRMILGPLRRKAAGLYRRHMSLLVPVFRTARDHRPTHSVLFMPAIPFGFNASPEVIRAWVVPDPGWRPPLRTRGRDAELRGLEWPEGLSPT